MGAEFELKYAADGKARQEIFAAFAGNWQTIAMETTYYDTPDHRLSAQKITLRQRLENGTKVCTVKTPGTHNLRGEWETESESIADAIPALCKLGGPEFLMDICHGLVPVCGARFTRQALTLEREGCVLELALDEGTLLGGGKACPLSEVEVELKSGSREAAEAFAAQLAAQFGLREEKKSKFRRAMDLATGAQHG